MSLPVILRPAADADIQATYDELEQLQAGLGGRFVARVRAARLRIFRHVVYYVIFADRVEVMAVIHGSRDASAWQSRV